MQQCAGMIILNFLCKRSVLAPHYGGKSAGIDMK